MNASKHHCNTNYLKEFDDFLRDIQDVNIKNALIVILREEIEDDFRKIPLQNPHPCTLQPPMNPTAKDRKDYEEAMKRMFPIRLLPRFQTELMRRFGKNPFHVLKRLDALCVPISWSYVITYPEPALNDAVRQMVSDYKYFKQHNTVYREPIRDQYGRIVEDVQPKSFIQRSYELVKTKILSFFWGQGQRQPDEPEQRAAGAAVMYRRHEHELNVDNVIPAANFGRGRLECDTCGKINQLGYIGCPECNYHECLECAIEHGYMTEDGAALKLEQVYNYIPEDQREDEKDGDDQDEDVQKALEESAAAAKALEKAAAGAAANEQAIAVQMRLDEEMARRLQEEDDMLNPRQIPAPFPINPIQVPAAPAAYQARQAPAAPAAYQARQVPAAPAAYHRHNPNLVIMQGDRRVRHAPVLYPINPIIRAPVLQAAGQPAVANTVDPMDVDLDQVIQGLGALNMRR